MNSLADIIFYVALAFVFAPIPIAYILIKRKTSASKFSSGPDLMDLLKDFETQKAPEPSAFPYIPKAVMTEQERILYARLVQGLPHNIVLAQAALSSFLKVEGNPANGLSLQKRIREQSIDFLILRKNYTPLAAVELRDDTDMRVDRKEDDQFKRKVFDHAGIVMLEFKADDPPSVEAIREALKRALAESSGKPSGDPENKPVAPGSSLNFS